MKNRSMIGLILFILMMTGCTNDKQARKSQDLSINEREGQELEQFEVGSEYFFPLTGLETSEPSTDRIVSVMVNNHPAARPQSGLSQADLVFEILAEGNITRLLAMFQSEKPDIVGPVRSARPYY